VLQAVGRLDGELATSDIRNIGVVAAAAVSMQRFTLVLVTVFGSIAVLLAGIGIFGVMSYSVAQRTHDIGVQLALGAPGRQIVADVVSRGLKIAVAGAAAGCVGAFGATRALESLLYGVAPRDPATFGAACFVVIAVAVLAAWIPARRAIGVDPVVALRQE
jgi:putative ABC transport system permease protein